MTKVSELTNGDRVRFSVEGTYDAGECVELVGDHLGQTLELWDDLDVELLESVRPEPGAIFWDADNWLFYVTSDGAAVPMRMSAGGPCSRGWQRNEEPAADTWDVVSFPIREVQVTE